MFLIYILLIQCAFTGYCFLTNGPTPGTTNNFDDVKKDLQSLRNLLLTANGNIFALQKQLAVANKAISSLQQDNLHCKATIGKLTQNQTRLSNELKQIKSNGALSVINKNSVAIANLKNDVSQCTRTQAQTRSQLSNSLAAVNKTVRHQEQLLQQQITSLSSTLSTGFLQLRMIHIHFI